MTQSEQNISQAILSISAIIDFVYGLLFLLIPRWLFEFSQDPGVPANPGWVRWAGALLVGVGIAAWLATADVKMQFLWLPITINTAFALTLCWVASKQP